MQIRATEFSTPGNDHLIGRVGKKSDSQKGKPGHIVVVFQFDDLNKGLPFIRTLSKWEVVEDADSVS